MSSLSKKVETIMWRAVFLISLFNVLFQNQRVSADEIQKPKQKIFILSVTVHSELKILPRDLQSQIKQEIPKDILEQRNLQFEDISVYTDIQQWNPANESVIRQGKYIQELLKRRNLRWMLLFSLSSSPDRQPPNRLLLTGRLYDLDRFGCLKTQVFLEHESEKEKKNGTESTSEAPKDKSPELCPDVQLEGSTDDVGIEASVSFDNLQVGLRQLFSKLFSIPQVEFDEALIDRTLLPDEVLGIEIGLHSNHTIEGDKLWVKREKRANAAWVDSTAKQFPDRSSKVEAIYYDFTETKSIKQVCSNPELTLKQLIQVDQEGGSRYASIINRKHIVLPVDVTMSSRGQDMRGFGIIRFYPPPIEGDYLLRINFSEREDGQDFYISSFPRFKCLHVREPSIIFHMSFGLQIPVFQNKNPSLSIQSGLSYAFELGIMRGFRGLPIQFLFPALRLGGVLTGSNSILASKAISDSFSPASVNLSYIDIKHVDIRGRLLLEITRIGAAGIFLTGGLGFGAMYVERGNSDGNASIGNVTSSWHPIFVAETGLGLSVWNANINWGGIFYFLYQWQRRLTELEKSDGELLDWGTDMHSIQIGFSSDIFVKRRKLPR